MMMYHRSLLAEHSRTPWLGQRRSHIDALPDTPLPSWHDANQGCREGADDQEEDDDSFIDPDEDGGEL